MLLTWLRNLKPFLMDGNHSQTSQTHNRDIINNKYLTNLVFSVHTVSNRSPFFPLWFMAPALCAWAINQRGKNLIHNIWCGPETRLVIGIYSTWSNYFIISYNQTVAIIFAAGPCLFLLGHSNCPFFQT